VKTPEIPISEIHKGKRFRVDYGEIDQLCYSIKKNGLITPIAVGRTANLSEELREDSTLTYTLLAGGRRLRAMEKLGWTMIPCRIYDQQLSELELRSIELAENFDRKEMTYAEEVALMKEINDLQTEIHGKKVARAANAPGWSQSDTAKLLSKSPGSVTKDLQLAEAILAHPELGLDKCKNKHEAHKLLKTVGKKIITEFKANEFKKSNINTDATYRKLSSAYVIADCRDVLAKLPSNTIDFVEIDPPYAIDLPSLKRDNNCDGYNEVPPELYLELMPQVFSQCYRAMRADSWLVCWFGPDPWFPFIAQWLRDAGFHLATIPGIWAKDRGQTMQPETYLASSYEMFFYARKGSPKIQKPGHSNIFAYPGVPAARKHHPTQRPMELMLDLYTTFCQPNSQGFIPFLGSGVGLLAGHAAQINMIGTDLSKSFLDGYTLMLKDYLSTLTS
jgi:site-specific DNA-methyltransferase (adenine-specific)